MRTEYTIPVRLDAKTFRRFGNFDMLRLRKKWVRPVLFAVILVAFAFLALLTRKEQSGMIAAVLLVVGLGLPLVYFGSFLSQMNMQVDKYHLDPPRRVYTVKLNFDGVHVTNNQQSESQVDVSWKDVQAAFRDRKCIYLYITPVRAFLLPDGQADCEPEELWAYIEKHIGSKARRL